MINIIEVNKKIKFIIAGSINTCFGYFIGILNFIIFYPKLNIIIISVLNNFLAISFSFLTYKFFVFKTKKTNWKTEYIKSYVVYLFVFLINTIVLWFSIEKMNLNIYISQAIAIIASVIISFVGHNKFTFRNN